MIEVEWPSRHTWTEARRNRDYVRKNTLPIETFTTATERADWIRRIEEDKKRDDTEFFTKEYDKLIAMVNGGPRPGYGFDVGLGDYDVRKELDDKLDQAHEAATRAFKADPANRLPIDEEAWQDELRRRSDFEHWLGTGEAVKTTLFPEYISTWDTLGAMHRARESDVEAIARDLIEFKSEVEWSMAGVCIDVARCKDPKEWARSMDAAYQSIQRSMAADKAVAAYLKARGAIITQELSEYKYRYETAR